jgi:hypothetical protein
VRASGAIYDVVPENIDMPGWTIKNVNELPDVSPPNAGVAWRFARKELQSPELGVSRFTHGSGRAMLDDASPLRSCGRSREAEELDVICIDGRRPTGGDSERFDDPWD